MENQDRQASVDVLWREYWESGGTADDLLEALRYHGFACVPLEPTDNMIEAAWADALEEDAAGESGLRKGHTAALFVF